MTYLILAKTERKTLKRVITRNLDVMFFLELVCCTAFWMFIRFLAKNALDLTLRLNDTSYMTSENFTELMLYPPNILMFAGIVLLFLFFLLFEMHAVLFILEASWKRKRITFLAALFRGFSGSLQTIRRHPKSTLPVLLLLFPYLCLHSLYSVFSNVQLLQVAAVKIYNFFPFGAIPIAFLVIWILCSFFFSYTIPFRIMMDEREKAVCQRALGQFIRSPWTAIRQNLLFQILAALFDAVIYLISMGLMVLLVYFLKKSSTQISSVLVYSDWIRMVNGVIAAVLGIIFSLTFQYSFFLATPRDEYTRSKKTEAKRGYFQKLRDSRAVSGIFLVLVLTLELGLFGYSASLSVPSPTASAQYIAVSAHRGGARMAPENTLAAIDYAIEIVADYAEIDVQETSDGELVLLHDNTLKRTTGLNASIWDLTLDEVRQLDAGAKFNKKFLGEKIPTLDEAIEEAGGRIKLNIEVKYNGHNDDIVAKVVDVIKAHHFEDQCVLTSMNYGFLKQAKQLDPDLKTGYTMKMTYGDLEDMDAADFFSVKNTYITESFVKRVHALGKEVLAWTLNYRGDIQRMVNCGVDNIITDDPELVRQVISGSIDGKNTYISLFLYAVGWKNLFAY